MEPARPVPPTDDQAGFVRDFVAPAAMRRYHDGDKAGAVDTFARGVFGPGYRERLAPGVFEQAVTDADAFFGQELPALQEWSFTEADAARVTQPVLALRGEHTAATFPERLELLTSWVLIRRRAHSRGGRVPPISCTFSVRARSPRSTLHLLRAAPALVGPRDLGPFPNGPPAARLASGAWIRPSSPALHGTRAGAGPRARRRGGT